METSIKCHWNSVLSAKGAKYSSGEISNMYLCLRLKDYDYARFNIDLIPPRIIAHYKLQGIIHKGYAYTRIKQAWYGLKQWGKIVHNDLVEHLKKYGYEWTAQIKGLFKPHTHDITFTLVVHDFGIKYTN